MEALCSLSTPALYLYQTLVLLIAQQLLEVCLLAKKNRAGHPLTPEIVIGAMSVKYSPLTIEDSSFVSSKAAYGGALLATGAQVTIRRSRFWQSSASDTGGAIYLEANATMYAEDVSFEDCRASAAAGIAAMVASVHLNRVVVSKVQATQYGGFLLATERDVVIENSSFDSTISLLSYGGAFLLQSMDNVLLRNISLSRSFAFVRRTLL
jgi:hypothetical protein